MDLLHIRFVCSDDASALCEYGIESCEMPTCSRPRSSLLAFGVWNDRAAWEGAAIEGVLP